VCRKLGINLTQEHKNGKFSFVNALSIPYSWCDFSGESSSGENLEGFHPFPTATFTLQEKDPESSIKKLYTTIKTSIQGKVRTFDHATTNSEDNKPKDQTQHGVIIIDTLSILLHSSSPLLVLDFVHYLKALLKSNPAHSIVVLTHGEAEDDFAFVKGLQHMADVTFVVGGLESGHSKDIHGQIEVSGVPHAPPLLHFKVFENNVQVFPPGTRT